MWKLQCTKAKQYEKAKKYDSLISVSKAMRIIEMMEKNSEV
jgi:hypothetical protein